MSTHAPQTTLPEVKDARVGIVVANWNSHITYALRDGALDVLYGQGFTDEDVDVFYVPGAVELTFAASHLIEASAYDAVIVFGCVIRGDTPHFDYVCQSVTQGVTALNADCDTPVIFGLLTVENEDQARERIGGTHGHKGREAAEAAIHMIDFTRSV
ncbi:MAG: 6,7-dimethyl-8-ribityllumazine synthase [Firmicutes bacterium]|nr:6,7-dimethyl-8-ribityllumazine synthase [Bacillota bacterium]MCM1400949.1 6,7-dimethyl-8-ribityllumazine synthase [Bacteroides sp.]MCM1476300.1 6,7-dimethyl-8-ribityllumazine synthase [Bacteroides sp.]